MTKRTDVDFSKHVLTLTKQLSPRIKMHELSINGSMYHRICFINTYGVCAVTGDFGNWMFNREFDPEEAINFGDEYMAGKVSMGNTHRPGVEYSPIKTEEYIRELLKTTSKNDYSKDRYNELMDYYRELLTFVEERGMYKILAYQKLPSFLDSESIPYVEDIPYHLKVVLDAFYEINKRIGEGDYISQ